MKGALQMSLKNDVTGGLLGLAVGDAFGVPVEFLSRKEVKRLELNDMAGCDTTPVIPSRWGDMIPAGAWSDDTSMMVATLTAICERGGEIDNELIMRYFVNWWTKSWFCSLDFAFGLGGCVARALERFTNGTEPLECGGRKVSDNGNGSLMRILPLAFVPCTDDEIRAVSAITHGHRISMDACVIFVHIAKRLLAGESICEIIPTLQYDKPFDRLHRIDQLSTSEIKSSGYVVDTLEAALWAVCHKSNNVEKEKSFRNGLLDAVNLGQDTDTVGAVAGGLAGIIYGLDEVSDWVEKLQNREELERYLW